MQGKEGGDKRAYKNWVKYNIDMNFGVESNYTLYKALLIVG